MPTYVASCNPSECNETAYKTPLCKPNEYCLGFGWTDETNQEDDEGNPIACCIWLCSTTSDYIIATLTGLIFPLLIILGIGLICVGFCSIRRRRRARNQPPTINVPSTSGMSTVSGLIIINEDNDKPPGYLECVPPNYGQQRPDRLIS